MELVLAIENLHKIREFRNLLKALPAVDVLSLRDFPDYQLPRPEGESFAENAKLKALDAARALQHLVVADASGLVIPSLDGGPGVRSRFYAGPNATEADNRKRVLEEMRAREGVERAACLECWLCLATPDGECKTVSAICEGEISEEELGGNGCEYDAIFRKLGYGKTFAQLEDGLRFGISARGKAIAKLMNQLEVLL